MTLAEVLAGRPPARLAGVIARFEAIEGALPPRDGIASFTHLYLEVTRELEQVLAAPGRAFFEDERSERWMAVVFADLFLEALRAPFLRHERPPRAWAPLIDARGGTGVARIQFALAGMNAHINRDLPVALCETWRALGLEPDRESPQFRDFERVNALLERVEERVRSDFATGPLGALDRALGRHDDAIAFWKIARAREAAWTNAETLWALRPLPHLQARFLLSLDRLVGLAARGLLVRVG